VTTTPVFSPEPTWLGPGLTVHWQATFVGPLPTGSFATLELYGANNEEVLWNIELGTEPDPRIGSKVIGLEVDQSTIQWNHSNQKTKQGDPVRLLYRLRQPDGTVLEQDELTRPLDSTVGLPIILRDIETTTGAAGGFTASDRTQLNLTQDQTQIRLPVLGGIGDFLAELGDWSQLSHGTVLSRGPVILLSGRGTLEITVLSGRGIPFGAFFSWFTIPAELGFMDGVVPHFNRPLFEVATIYADIGLNEYRQDLKVFTEDGYFWDWLGKVPPERLDYWVLPGVVVAWQFMYTKP